MKLTDIKELNESKTKDIIKKVVFTVAKTLGTRKITAQQLTTMVNLITPIVKPLIEIEEGHKWNKSNGRDYSKEKAYNNSPERRKYRAELNRENRKRGDYGNSDGKDLHHVGNGKFRKEPSSTNKGRSEKSRKKGYNSK